MMPYAAPIDSRFMMTAFSGTSSERNTSINSRKLRMSTAPMRSGSRPPSQSAKSMLAGVEATDLRGHAGGGNDVVAQPVHERRRVGVLRRRGGIDLHEREVVGDRDRVGGRGDTLGRAQRLGELGQLRLIARRVPRDGHDDRPVEAGPEALGEQVVRAARRLLLGQVAGVAEPEPQREQRRREQQQDDQRDRRMRATDDAG